MLTKIHEPLIRVITFLRGRGGTVPRDLCHPVGFIYLSSLIPSVVVSFDGPSWPLPPVLVERLSSLAHNTAVSWSCPCLPCGPSPSVTVTTPSPPPGPLLSPCHHLSLGRLTSSIKNHGLVSLTCTFVSLWSRPSHQLPHSWTQWTAETKCQSRLGCFKDTSLQNTLSHAQDFCLCLWSSGPDH